LFRADVASAFEAVDGERKSMPRLKVDWGRGGSWCIGERMVPSAGGSEFDDADVLFDDDACIDPAVWRCRGGQESEIYAEGGVSHEGSREFSVGRRVWLSTCLHPGKNQGTERIERRWA